MLMQGGACAAEPCLMVGRVCVYISVWCWLSDCGWCGEVGGVSVDFIIIVVGVWSGMGRSSSHYLS